MLIAPDPLTVEFANLPDTHDGATAFSFRLDFSEDVDIEPRGHARPRADGGRERP